jgi:hypothetical protein
MFATPYFVYVHVPKTGGNFVREIAERHFGIEWTSPRHHEHYELLPPPYRHLPALAFVRNPWDWYVSYWAFTTRVPGDAPLHRAAEQGFEAFVSAATQRNVQGNSGFYSVMFWSKTRGVEIERVEHLRTDLLAFFNRHEIPIAGSLERDVVDLSPINVTTHDSYQAYYNDETQALVAVECQEIIEKFGYRFLSLDPPIST